MFFSKYFSFFHITRVTRIILFPYTDDWFRLLHFAMKEYKKKNILDLDERQPYKNRPLKIQHRITLNNFTSHIFSFTLRVEGTWVRKKTHYIVTSRCSRRSQTNPLWQLARAQTYLFERRNSRSPEFLNYTSSVCCRRAKKVIRRKHVIIKKGEERERGGKGKRRSEKSAYFPLIIKRRGGKILQPRIRYETRVARAAENKSGAGARARVWAVSRKKGRTSRARERRRKMRYIAARIYIYV